MPLDPKKLDLELALRRVKADVDRGFISIPLEFELVQADEAAWLAQLSQKVTNGYNPGPATIADVPKGNGGVRPAVLLSLEDRVVYAATVGAFLPQINAGLKWSQGKIDFSYRLSEQTRRVEWFTNAFNSWSAFRIASVSKSSQAVVITDITGFYENIDLTTLFSDLRTLNCDAEIIQLLQSCLNRWAVVPNRGLPQGMSPSDVLAKVYLNPIDQGMIDAGVDFIRYVDDIRIFCRDIPAAKKSLAMLIGLLRRRGLNLQSAKTQILSLKEAKVEFEGIQPVLEGVFKEYKEQIAKIVGVIDPYAPITAIEETVDSKNAPLHVIQAAFKSNFLNEGARFNKTLLHYLLNRLGAQKDSFALDYCLANLQNYPQETQAFLDYLSAVGHHEKAFARLANFLRSADNVYDYQVFQILDWISRLDVKLGDDLIAISRNIAFDNGRPAYLRAVARTILQEHGSVADLDRLEGAYGGTQDQLERAQILMALTRMETGRRNTFYSRASGDGDLCARAVTLAKRDTLSSQVRAALRK